MPERIAIHSCCMEYMRTLPACSVDSVVTNPPYGTTETGRSKRTLRGGKVVAFAHEWDQVLPTAWLSEVERLLKPGGAVLAFTDAKRPGDLWEAGESAGLRALHTFYWEKPDPPPNPRKNFASAIEVGVFFRKPGRVLAWNGGGWCRNVFRAPLAHKEQGGQLRHHPTEKPVSLMRWLVKLATPQGGIVLDPFMGSGTTGVACIAEDLGFVGIERDPEYAAIAVARLASAAHGIRPVEVPMQTEMFAVGVSHA